VDGRRAAAADPYPSDGTFPVRCHGFLRRRTVLKNPARMGEQFDAGRRWLCPPSDALDQPDAKPSLE
jgi:hypothetical protein